MPAPVIAPTQPAVQPIAPTPAAPVAPSSPGLIVNKPTNALRFLQAPATAQPVPVGTAQKTKGTKGKAEPRAKADPNGKAQGHHKVGENKKSPKGEWPEPKG